MHDLMRAPFEIVVRVAVKSNAVTVDTIRNADCPIAQMWRWHTPKHVHKGAVVVMW